MRNGNSVKRSGMLEAVMDCHVFCEHFLLTLVHYGAIVHQNGEKILHLPR